MDVRWFAPRAPLVQVFSVFIEYLDSMIGTIVHKNAPGLRIDGNAMNIIHVAWPRFIRRITFHSPVEKKLAVLIELRDTRSVISIGHKHRAVRKPCQKRRTVEVRTVGAGHFRRADRLY